MFTYTAIMHCWAKSNRNDAAKRTENLFRRMTDRYEAGDMDYCPDNLAYACLINSFVKNGDSVRAEEILWEMVNAYIRGNEKAKPSARNFNTVLAMLANEKSEDASERAENIVRRLIELNAKNVFSVKPDEFSFSLLLKSWYVAVCKCLYYAIAVMFVAGIVIIYSLLLICHCLSILLGSTLLAKTLLIA